MSRTVYDIAILYFTYSFLAWLAETTVATIKEKDFRNRGFASGPFCFIYGFTGALLTIVFQDLRGNVFSFSGMHGSGYRRRMVYRENSGGDEAEEMVGLFRQKVESGRLYLPPVLPALGRTGLCGGTIYQRHHPGPVSYPARPMRKNRYLGTDRSRPAGSVRFPSVYLPYGKKASPPVSMESEIAAMDSAAGRRNLPPHGKPYPAGLPLHCRRV